MHITQEVIDLLTHIEFLGEKKEVSLYILPFTKLKDAEKSITGLRWQNAFLDKRGDLTFYLSKNEAQLYSHWNDLVDECDEQIIPILVKKLSQLVADGQLTEAMIPSIQFDFTHIAVYLTYKVTQPNIQFDFFDDLLELYQAGYIPCGYHKGYYKVL